MKRYIFILFFLFAGLKSYEQNEDSVYESPDILAQHRYSVESARFVFKAIHALSKSDCRGEEYPLPTNLKIIFTIGKDGKVLDASFPALDASAACKELLRKEFLAMKGWEAGKVNGQRVVSKAPHFIPCILWQEQ